MSDITSLAVQKVTKPNIEDVLPHYLSGEMLKNALDFVAYLRKNKMKPSWTIHNAWKATYKGKPLYYIRLPLYDSHFYRPNQPAEITWERSWTVTPYLLGIEQYQHQITDETDQQIVMDNLYGCKPNCIEPCNSETKLQLFGKEIVKNCDSGGTINNRSLWIVNPNEREIAAIKKFMELEKQARDAQKRSADQAKKNITTNKVYVEKLTNGTKLPNTFGDTVEAPAFFNGTPQMLNVIRDDDGTEVLHIETEETPRDKRRGFYVAKGIKFDGNLAVEVKVKPIDGLDGVFELWLLGNKGEHLCMKFNSTHANKFAMEAIRYNDTDYNIVTSKHKLKFMMNEWYYLHTQLKKDEVNMLLLDADRAVVDQRTFDTPAGFDSFDIALAHFLGPRTKKTYLFKAYVESVIVANC